MMNRLHVHWLIIIAIIFIFGWCKGNELITNEENSEKILSRQRRYLIFPSGSSFQIVADSHRQIVDHTNLFVMGITGALAWELPSEPIYYDELLMELYENGTLPLLNRADDNISDLNYTLYPNNENHVNEKLNNYQTLNNGNGYLHNSPYIPLFSSGLSKNKNYYNSVPKIDQYYYGQSNNDNYKTYKNYYYATKSPSSKSDKLNYYFSYANRLFDEISKFANPKFDPSSKDNWNYITNRISDTLGLRNPLPNKAYYRQKPSKYPSDLRRPTNIHPIFGKRSTESNELSPEEKFYLNHHSQSRYGLYKRIEVFLETKGIDGQECVLKSLCESGQRRNDVKPGNFLVEIMRAVFSLPKTTKVGASDQMNKQYVDAHFSENIDCEKHFPRCVDSIWSKDFVF